MRRLAGVLAFSLAVAACGSEPIQEAPAPTPKPNPLDELIPGKMRDGGIPGAGAAIVKNGEIVWQGEFGEADIEARKAVTFDSIFVVASISKTILAVSLMQLVEEGKLDLDEPLETYLPFAVRHPGHAGAAINARDLMTHTSGLLDDWLKLGSATGDGDSRITLREFAEGYVTPGGRFWSDNNFGPEPHTRRRYCNAAFGVLGDLVEAVSQRPLPELAREKVFQPLGMTHTGWRLADVDASLLATPYGGSAGEYTRLNQQGYGFYPATGLRTSARDLSRFLLAFIAEGGGVLSAETVRAMETPQHPSISATQALVWSIDEINGRKYYGHSGSTAGGAGYVAYSRESGIGIVFITNSDAYVRARFGFNEGQEAMDAIIAAIEDHAVNGDGG